MNRIPIKKLLREPGDGRSVTAYGWIRTKRDGKNVVFLEISDGSSFSGVQAVIDKSSGIIDEEMNRRTADRRQR